MADDGGAVSSKKRTHSSGGDDGRRSSKRLRMGRDQIIDDARDLVENSHDLSARLESFIEDAQAQVGGTDADWPGLTPDNEVIVGGDLDLSTNDHLRQRANEMGEDFGCHTCLTDISIDRDQPWIGDHNPPTGLPDALRQHLGLADSYLGSGPQRIKLYPQCQECSNTQASIVRLLSADSNRYKAPAHARYIGLEHRHTHCIDATGDKVSASQRKSIGRLGGVHGCHTCPTRIPASVYHADHDPPVFLTFTHVLALFEVAGEDPPYDREQGFRLRPQCPRCSNRQGGAVSDLRRRAFDLAQDLGIPVLRE